jgi:hypothetical protein
MKNLKRIMFGWLLLFPFWTANASPGLWSDPGVSPTALQDAHEAYLSGDLKKMASSLKSAIETGDPAVKTNAYALLEEAYKEARLGKVPVDWKFPAGITDVAFAIKHYERPDGENYAVKLSGRMPSRGLLKQMQVIRYPSEVVLDLSAKIGDYEEQAEDNEWYFELHGKRTAQPAAEGLYLLNLELTSGEITHGWFILSNLTSSQTPLVKTPRVGQTFITATPTMKWDDFISPEYNGRDNRSIYLEVAKSDAPKYDWIDIWHLHETDPTRTEVTIGDGGLEDGRYVFAVTYNESRKFGDLTLARRSVTLTPFHIKTR